MNIASGLDCEEVITSFLPFPAQSALSVPPCTPPSAAAAHSGSTRGLQSHGQSHDTTVTSVTLIQILYYIILFWEFS